MNPHRIADHLGRARQTHTAITPFSERLAGFDLTSGYAVQRMVRTQRTVTGWKLGLTSRAKQRQVGVDAPLYGYLDASDALSPHQPLATAELIAPRAEPEIVFLLGKDLGGPHVSYHEVLDATEAVAAGIEILDSRYRDYRFAPADLAADNVSAGRHLVGVPRSSSDVDLSLLGVSISKNGHLVDTAAGAAVMGHPATAVAWLARQLDAQEGERLRRGQIVFSGGLTAAVPIRRNDVFTADFDHLGHLTLVCQ